LIDVGSIVLQRVRVLGAGLDGVGIYSPFPHTAVIEDCTIRGTGANGIVFQTGSAEIRNNRVISAGYGGILLSGATGSEVSGNLVVGAANDVGITLSATQGSTIAGNVVRSSYFHGIWVQSDSANNVVRDNVSTGNGLPTPGHGLFVQGTANMIEGNTLNGNGGAGLFFNFTGCGNTFGRNMARGNVGSGVGGCGALFAPESCTQCGAGTANVSFGDNLIPGPPAF
jgi:parallel beta-helix repeat protein